MSRSVIGQFLSPSDLHVWSGHVASLCGLSVTGLILCGPMEVVTQLCALFSAISTISGLPMQSWSWSYCEVHLGGVFLSRFIGTLTRGKPDAKRLQKPSPPLKFFLYPVFAPQQRSRTAGQQDSVCYITLLFRFVDLIKSGDNVRIDERNQENIHRFICEPIKKLLPSDSYKSYDVPWHSGGLATDKTLQTEVW